jgi:hypothetical protein
MPLFSRRSGSGKWVFRSRQRGSQNAQQAKCSAALITGLSLQTAKPGAGSFFSLYEKSFYCEKVYHTLPLLVKINAAPEQVLPITNLKLDNADGNE